MIQSIISRFVAQFSRQPAGTIGGILQLAVVFIAMPAQIWTNYQNHSTAGVCGLLFILGGLASAVWIIHAIREAKSPPLLVSQVPSVFFSAVIVWQTISYS